jgi:hypothetical protein
VIDGRTSVQGHPTVHLEAVARYFSNEATRICAVPSIFSYGIHAGGPDAENPS